MYVACKNKEKRSASKMGYFLMQEIYVFGKAKNASNLGNYLCQIHLYI
jgi:hypothetical protein